MLSLGIEAAFDGCSNEIWHECNRKLRFANHAALGAVLEIWRKNMISQGYWRLLLAEVLVIASCWLIPACAKARGKPVVINPSAHRYGHRGEPEFPPLIDMRAAVVGTIVSTKQALFFPPSDYYYLEATIAVEEVLAGACGDSVKLFTHRGVFDTPSGPVFQPAAFSNRPDPSLPLGVRVIVVLVRNPPEVFPKETWSEEYRNSPICGLAKAGFIRYLECSSTASCVVLRQTGYDEALALQAHASGKQGSAALGSLVTEPDSRSLGQLKAEIRQFYKRKG